MKTTVFILLSALLTLIPETMTMAGKKDHSPDDINRIEKKYEELRKTSPYVKANGVQVAQHIRFIEPSDNAVSDYSKLRQIALVRHGEPDMDKTGKFNYDEANQFLKCYDSVCIVVPEKPFFNIGDEEQVKVFSSPINRALTTAHYLCGVDKDITVSPDFREFETRINSFGSKKRLPIRFWTTAARTKWMLGIGKQKGIETFTEAKQRARRAAQTLADASQNNSKILLTSHGLLNRYIKKNLKKMGWKVVEDTGNNYFGTTILVKVEK